MSSARALDALAATRPPRVAHCLATRDRPELLAPAREIFDGRVPGATAVFDAPLEDAEPTAELAEKFFADPSPAEAALAALAASGEADPPGEDAFVLIGEGGERDLPELLRAELVAECAETIGMLARHRAERPMSELADNERQLVAQVDAIAASGADCVRALVAWWRKNADDPWKASGSVFTLACLDGIDVLQAIASELEALTGDATAFVEPLADALVVSPHPHLGDLAQALRRSENPIARAVGIDVLGRHGALAADDLRIHLGDPHLAVVAAAVRASAPLSPAEGVPLVHPHLANKDAIVAWPAARQLLLWGRPEPYFDVCAGRAQQLGAYALEVLVYAGAASDLETLERVLARLPPSEAHLSAVARFGAPSAWAFLVHHLDNPDLEDAAARALVTLYGDRVPPSDATKPAAWRSAITQAKLDPNVRYRRGEPWRPRAVCAECARGPFSRGEMRARLDELTARTGVRPAVDLARWAPDAWGQIMHAVTSFQKADGHYPPGTWTTRAR